MSIPSQLLSRLAVLVHENLQGRSPAVRYWDQARRIALREPGERYVELVGTEIEAEMADRHEVVALQIAPGSRLPMKSMRSVEIEDGRGIVGDRYHKAKHRQVTLQSLEEIAEAEAEVGRRLDAIHTRRNITISSGRLDRTPGTRIVVGPVELEVVRDAAPCKLLEDDLGRDAKLALHKRAGVVARTIRGGTISLGDEATLG